MGVANTADDLATSGSTHPRSATECWSTQPLELTTTIRVSGTAVGSLRAQHARLPRAISAAQPRRSPASTCCCSRPRMQQSCECSPVLPCASTPRAVAQPRQRGSAWPATQRLACSRVSSAAAARSRSGRSPATSGRSAIDRCLQGTGRSCDRPTTRVAPRRPGRPCSGRRRAWPCG